MGRFPWIWGGFQWIWDRFGALEATWEPGYELDMGSEVQGPYSLRFGWILARLAGIWGGYGGQGDLRWLVADDSMVHGDAMLVMYGKKVL